MANRRPRVLLIGGGGREHAIARALSDSKSQPQIFAAPGNAGLDPIATRYALPITDVEALVALAKEKAVDLVVIGPEAPLLLGLTDALRAAKIPVFGPTKAAARLEGSKAFAKSIMEEAGVPTARWRSFSDPGEASAFAVELGGRVAVKADGLAAGKGVIVTDDPSQARRAIADLRLTLPEAAKELVIEERLEGEELSVLAISDGSRAVLLEAAQDHKRLKDGDRGPNTGGMGALSPSPRATEKLLAEVMERSIQPIVSTMAARGTPFLGVLYAGMMLTPEGPKVLEYNARFGDPEAQVIFPRLAVDVYELLLDAALGSLPEHIQFHPKSAVTVVLAASGYPGEPKRGDLIHGLDEVQDPEVVIFVAGAERRGRDLVTSGGRVLNVTALGDTLLAARARAYGAVEKISFEGMVFRRDIGLGAG